MFQLASFEEVAGVAHGIEILNPHLVARIRRAADQLTRHEIAGHLASAITEAADAVHSRSFEQAQFGEASADVIVDCEYHDQLAAAWSLVAAEHQLVCPDLLFTFDGSVH